MLPAQLLSTILLLPFLAVALTVPKPATIDLIPKPFVFNLSFTTLNPLPINISAPPVHPFSSSPSLNASENRFWTCFLPSRKLHVTTFNDCHGVAEALRSLDPTGREDFFFSPRPSADIRLPFHLRWGSCVLDLRGKEEDSWDVFPMWIMAAEVDALALT
ncbi:hypothetical protein G7Y79_00061g092830 [Physcia stellaris]|nr:hypothetical protein G7Y79_00061g092830 [Physcia stellaris]